MKIKKVHIDGFGKWYDQEFTFTTNPQLIYGPNEAGKTTLMAFIVSILFGFADGRGKNRFDQYIPKKTSSYGGSVLIEVNGQEYLVRRQQGKNNGKVTVTDSKGQQGDEGKLKKLLGTMDRSLYQSLFSFGQRDLVTVDELNRQEWQHHLQQLGATGSDRWSKMVDQYQKHADQLYKPRGRKWPLNQDLRHYAALTEKIRQGQEKFHRYQELQQQLTTNQSRLQQAKKAIVVQEPRQKQLTRLVQLWPVYQKWQGGQATNQQTKNYLNDEQVATVQALQVKESEIRRQQDNYQKRLAILSDRPQQTVPLSFSQLRRLKEQVVNLQAEDRLQKRQEGQVQRWEEELTAIYQRYNSPLPAPLQRQERDELARLFGPTGGDRTSQPKAPSRLPMIGIVGGFILFVIGLLTNATFLTAVGAIVTFATIMYLYYHQEGDRGSQLTGPSSPVLKEFGIQHGLQAFPPDQWLMMQGDLQRNAELSNQIAEARKDTQKFTAELANFNRQLPPSMQGYSLDEIRTKLDELLEHRQNVQQDAQVNTREKATIAGSLARLEDELADVVHKKQDLYRQAGVGNDDQFAAYLTQRAAAQSQALAADAYGQQLTAHDRQILANYTSEQEITAALAKVERDIHQLNSQITAFQTAIQNERLEITNLVEDGTLSSLEQERANLATQIWKEVQEWLTYQLAVQWINQALIRASADRYPAIIQRAEQYFSLLTGERYSNINLDDDGIKVVRKDHEIFLVEELSQGTAEQLYISLRLGFATVMSDQANFPVIIDDGFVNFDNVRRQRMLALLEKVAEKNQVLYFTADDRIKKLGGNVLDLQALNRE